MDRGTVILHILDNVKCAEDFPISKCFNIFIKSDNFFSNIYEVKKH